MLFIMGINYKVIISVNRLDKGRSKDTITVSDTTLRPSVLRERPVYCVSPSSSANRMKFQWMFISLLVFLPEWKAEGGSLPKTPFTPPSPSRLGKFRTAAVSSDAGICSDIGR